MGIVLGYLSMLCYFLLLAVYFQLVGEGSTVYFCLFIIVLIGVSMSYRLAYHLLWAVYGIGFAVTTAIVLLIAAGFCVRMFQNSKVMTAEIARWTKVRIFCDNNKGFVWKKD